ncbi:MAG: type II toxin-antitoxin system HicA family toxin [archaeon]|mgnify:CR=1 FL=1
MHKLPFVSAKEVIKVSSMCGFHFVRQSGSHIVMKNNEGKMLVIPNHNPLKKGTLLQIIKSIGVDKEEFSKLL